MAVTVALALVPCAATAAPRTRDVEARSTRAHADARYRGDAQQSADTTHEASQRRRKWSRCTEDVEPCHRPGPARVLLLSLGLIGGAAAAGLLFALGDRHSIGDPATLLVGTGALAGVGALVGMVAGALGADGSALPDRVRPATVGLGWTWRGASNLGEREPQGLSLSWAPTWWLGRDARLRLVGHFGGWPGTRKQVDPRPQVADAALEGDGTAPVALRQQRLTAGVGLDLAVALPYPAVRRSAFLGPAELRFRPTFEIRRERHELGDAQPRTIERTMLLPLTAGARWHITPRQRFTFYLGPRFDLVAYREPGSGSLSRGNPMLGPLYGEAWYDIDVPLTPGRRRDGRTRTVDATSMITLGYVHSKFDGIGFNFGPVIGFLGPVHVGFISRIRPRGSLLAFQAGANARIGNGVSVTLDVGLVAPDLRPRGAR